MKYNAPVNHIYLWGICMMLLIIACDSSPKALFTDITEMSGINFQNHIQESITLNVLNFEYMYNGGGVPVFKESAPILFFLGLDNYVPELLFSPTLFVEIRKKLGNDTFGEFNRLIIRNSHPDLLERKSETTDLVAEEKANKGKTQD